MAGAAVACMQVCCCSLEHSLLRQLTPNSKNLANPALQYLVSQEAAGRFPPAEPSK